MDTSEYPDNVEPGKDEVWLVISFTVLFNYALALFADCSCPGPGFLPWGIYCPPNYDVSSYLLEIGTKVFFCATLHLAS